MGLSQGVAICTAQQCADISHESELTSLDSTGTLSAALVEATNEIIRRVRARGVDPALLDSDTVTELRAAAAFHALYSTFASQPQGDEGTRLKTESYRARFLEQMNLVVLRTSTAGALTVTPQGTPFVMNHNSGWVNGGVDVQRPGARPPLGPYQNQ